MPLNEQQRTFSASSYETFDVFLSYNINDKIVVRGIYYMLAKMGYKVYVDFIVDPQMSRSNVTKDTYVYTEQIKTQQVANLRPVIKCSHEQMDAMGTWCR